MSFTKEGRQQLTIDMLDLATLLYHLHQGAKHPEVGYEDCTRSIERLTSELSPKRVAVPLYALESALWSANLMDEVGSWWSPKGETLEQFLKRVLEHASRDMKLEFNRTYNQIRNK